LTEIILIGVLVKTRPPLKSSQEDKTLA